MQLSSPMTPAAAFRFRRTALASPLASWAVISGFLIAGVLLVVALSIQLPLAGRQTVLFFDPSLDGAQAMHALQQGGGRVIDVGAAETILVAQFDRDLGWGDLDAMGVWAAFDPTSLVGCLAAPPSA